MTDKPNNDQTAAGQQDGVVTGPVNTPATHLDAISFRGLGQIVKNVKRMMPELLDGDPEMLGRTICCAAACEKLRGDSDDVQECDWRNGDSDNTKRLNELLRAQAATVSKHNTEVRLQFDSAHEATAVYFDLSR